MPTDHACQAAADAVAHSLGDLREYLGDPGEYGGGFRQRYRGSPDGAAGLLTFLDGLHAELHGALTGWHSTVGHRILDVLGLPVPGAGGGAASRPSGWEALTVARYRAEEILTALSVRPRGDATGTAGLPRRLELVEDVFAGALRRLAVPAGESADRAAEVAAATGSLFGMHPVHRPRAADPSPAPAPARQPGPPVVAFPQMGDIAQGGMP
ncbi:hypothetical protein ACIF9R_20020 [Streptomyces sp. NPDC086080]|uniref:hypothetical protein n=1 Tax=Streptomyces sp. NPDC086080 TaxID=3365748 RepID=UPI0037D8F5F6